MSLEFQRPFSFNPNEETPSQRSLGNFNHTLSGLGDFAQSYGQQQHQNRVQDALLALHKQQTDRERMDWERQNSGTLPMIGDQQTGSADMTPQGTTSWNPSPFDMGRQPFSQSPNYNAPQSAPDQFSGPQAMHSPNADLTSHFNAWKQQGGGAYNHPEMSGMMSDPNNPMSQWNQYAQMPGSKNRSEKMLFDKEQSALGLQASETAKNQATADLLSRSQGKGITTPNSTWETATPQERALAQGVLDGNVTMAAISFRDKTKVASLAQERADMLGIPFTSYEGDVKKGMAENTAYGKIGQNALGVNTALGHANDAYQAYQDVKNVDANFLNTPINKLMLKTNDPSIIALNLNLNALQGELETVFRNGGNSDKGVETWAKYLNSSLTPNQYVAAVKKVDGLLRSRTSAMEYQRGNVMNQSVSNRKILSPHSEEFSRNLSSAGVPTNGQQGAPDGSMKVLNGTRYEKRGGQWYPAQ